VGAPVSKPVATCAGGAAAWAVRLLAWGAGDMGAVAFHGPGSGASGGGGGGGGAAPGGHFDVIVASECAYREESLVPLVQTLLRYAHADTTVFVGLRRRHVDAEDRLLAILAQCFVLAPLGGAARAPGAAPLPAVCRYRRMMGVLRARPPPPPPPLVLSGHAASLTPY